MNKRLLKRHKRQVSRAKAKVRLSEPDVRTPEQIRAARAASRSATDLRTGAHARYSTPPTQRQAEIAGDAPQRPDGAAGESGPHERGKEVL